MVTHLEADMQECEVKWVLGDITLPTKVHLVKAMVFPVVMMDVRVGL